MKRRRSLFLHLNQLKLLAKKFALVILFLAAILMMLLNKNDALLAERPVGFISNIFVPVVDILVVPAKILVKAYNYIDELRKIKLDNQILKEENIRLKTLQDSYRTLEVENKLLTDLLNYVPLPDAKFISARMIAEEKDAFSHSMVAYIGREDISKGDVVLSDQGVVGRIDKVSGKYAKIILLTDINSKIPVMVENSRIRGILSGDNTLIAKLVFTPLGTEINVGDRIVTSGVSGVFPAGLPVGQVVGVYKNEIRVKPFSTKDKVEYIKIVKYGIPGLLKEQEEDINE